MNRTLAIAVLTFTLVFGIGAVAYGVIQATTIHVTVQHTPTPAVLTLTSPTNINVSLATGESDTATITLHNSGESPGSVTLTLTITPATPVLPYSFSNVGTQHSKTLTVPAGGDATATVYIGPAPSSTVDLSYTITVTGV